MTKLEELKKKIMLLLPDINSRNTSVIIPKPFGGIINHYDNKITLEDILIVLNKKWNDERFATGESMEELWGLYCEWQLGKNLEQQSTDTIKYLNEII